MLTRGTKLGLRLAGGAAGVALVAALLVIPGIVERRVRARLQREADKRDLVIRIGDVRFSYIGPLQLKRLELERAGRFKLTAASVGIGWRFARERLERLRSVALDGVRIELPGDTTLTIEDSTWDVDRLLWDRIALSRRGERDRLTAEVPIQLHGARRVDAEFSDLDVGRLVTVRRGAAVPFRGGRWTGRATIRRLRDDAIDLDFFGLGRGIQVAAMSDPAAGLAPGPDAGFGSRTNVEVSTQARFDPAQRRLSISCGRLIASGVEIAAAGTLETGENDVAFDFHLDVPRVELASVLATSGVDLPAGATLPGGDLGSVALTADAAGHFLDPDSIAVSQHLTFRPPAGGVHAFDFLKSSLTFALPRPEGDRKIVLVNGAPDYVPLENVPPLFVRALTISEDAGFWGHSGIDLGELPVAWATNWVRGDKSRGASTLSQQLVKNLFLSRRKSYDRKVQELALTLLLESSLGKRRILEIYLNVIEWGPGVYGLRPAARRYFGKEPAALTPKEMVFLVSLIPSPIRYQTSFAKGAVTRNFNVLLTNLLAKLRSVDALTEEEYEAARAEELVFRRSDAPLGPVSEPATRS
ncbi:MAG: biosynthetic peptidoglycan transglycosylase [Thermoanaerobaculia bacterium]